MVPVGYICFRIHSKVRIPTHTDTDTDADTHTRTHSNVHSFFLIRKQQPRLADAGYADLSLFEPREGALLAHATGQPANHHRAAHAAETADGYVLDDSYMDSAQLRSVMYDSSNSSNSGRGWSMAIPGASATSSHPQQQVALVSSYNSSPATPQTAASFAATVPIIPARTATAMTPTSADSATDLLGTGDYMDYHSHTVPGNSPAAATRSPVTTASSATTTQGNDADNGYLKLEQDSV